MFVYTPHEPSLRDIYIYKYREPEFLQGGPTLKEPSDQGLHVLPARHWLRARDVTALGGLQWDRATHQKCAGRMDERYQWPAIPATPAILVDILAWCFTFSGHVLYPSWFSQFIRRHVASLTPRSYLAAMLLLYLPSYQAFASTSEGWRQNSTAQHFDGVGPLKVGLCNLLNTPSVTQSDVGFVLLWCPHLRMELRWA